MAKKTNKGIYKAAQVKWDKANRPHQSEPDFVLRYEEARLEWMKLKVKDFEVTEFARVDLLPFIRSKNFGSTNRISSGAVAPDRIFARTSLTGVFNFECNGKVTPRTLKITPRSQDTDDETDPFNQPIDTDPMYEDDNEGAGEFIQILSQSIPSNVILKYIKYPEPYNLRNAPDGTTEEDELQQNEIIDLAVEKYFASTRDFQAVQAQSLETQSKGI